MNKKVMLVCVAVLLLTSLVAAQAAEVPFTQRTIDGQKVSDLIAGAKEAGKQNPWNETVILSAEWQQVFAVLFGLNLKKQSTEISVNEAILLILLAVMLFVVLQNIFRWIPFLDRPFLKIPSAVILATLLTFVVAITGNLLLIKVFFMNLAHSTLDQLALWGFPQWMTENKFAGTLITVIFIIPLIAILWLVIDYFKPLIRRYIQLKTAEVRGKSLRRTVDENMTRRTFSGRPI